MFLYCILQNRTLNNCKVWRGTSSKVLYWFDSLFTVAGKDGPGPILWQPRLCSYQLTYKNRFFQPPIQSTWLRPGTFFYSVTKCRPPHCVALACFFYKLWYFTHWASPCVTCRLCTLKHSEGNGKVLIESCKRIFNDVINVVIHIFRCNLIFINCDC